jgi:SAM-dependent methyltransferase/GNAT superfamily N-acetyltransferase
MLFGIMASLSMLQSARFPRHYHRTQALVMASYEPTIRQSKSEDFDSILGIINSGAMSYKEEIPAASYKEPYMDAAELENEISKAGAGIDFWIAEVDGTAVGVMGIQDRKVSPTVPDIASDVVLIRHAYTSQSFQRGGVGTKLLRHLLALPQRDVPMLIGTWAANLVAIQFYQRHGFTLIKERERKDQLLRTYWFSASLGEINDAESDYRRAQMDASVVLADARWFSRIERLRGGASSPRDCEWSAAWRAEAPHEVSDPVRPKEEPTETGASRGLAVQLEPGEYLERFWALPTVQAYKRGVQAWMALAPGCSVLDVGCGLGHDMGPLAKAAGPSGSVLGIDVNVDLVRRAKMRVRAENAADPSLAAMSVDVGDACRLPASMAGRFDVVREDRMLQHQRDPSAALRQMRDAAKPRGQGRVVCSSPDWRTLRFEVADGAAAPPELAALTAAVLDAAVPTCTAHPSLGAELPALLHDCGLANVVTRTDVLEMRSWRECDAVVVMAHFAAVAVRCGLPAAEAERWLALMQQQGEALRGELTVVTACGRVA